MKVVRKGNTYKKESWLKEHEEDIYIFLIIMVAFGIFVFTSLIRW